MARRTVTITHLQYSKKHARGDDKYKDLCALPDDADFLEFFHSVWNGATSSDLLDRTEKKYCEPLASETRGRCATYVASVGTYGDPASIKEVEDGSERLSHNGELTSSVPARLALFVPKGRTRSALLFIEHISDSPSASPFFEYFKHVWSNQYPAWTLHSERLTRPDAWLKSAELQQITAEIHKHQADLADQGKGKQTVGILRSVIVPPKGTSHLPRKVLEALEKRKLNRASLLGLPEEPDEVKVTLGDGDQRRTFVLGKDKTPAVRLLVTDHGETALTDKKFLNWCSREAGELFKNVGAKWETRWEQEPWADEALKATLRL